MLRRGAGGKAEQGPRQARVIQALEHSKARGMSFHRAPCRDVAGPFPELSFICSRTQSGA